MIADKLDHWITVWCKGGALFLLGWFASSACHGIMTLDQKAATLQHIQQVDIPKLKAADHCEHARADKAATLAKTAIVGATSDTIPIPPPTAIPQDNCPHPK